MNIEDTQKPAAVAQTETGAVTTKVHAPRPKPQPKPKKMKAKPAKKVTAKKAKSSSGKSRTRYHAEDRFVVTEKKNPRRAGTKKHKLYELLLKHSNGTIGAFLKAGGDMGALLSMVKRKRGHVTPRAA